MPSSLVTRMRVRERSGSFTLPASLGRAGNRREAVHVGPQRLGDGHRAILVLVVLQHGDQGPADGKAGTVQGVHEAGALALLWPEAGIHAPRLVLAAVGAARDL